MDKILVPFDFSEQATNALRFALQLHGQAKAEIHLLHIVELLVRPIMGIGLDEELLQGFRTDVKKDALSRFQEEVVNKYIPSNDKVRIHVEIGYTSATILSYIAKNDIDLVIMGTRGATGMREMLIGSNTEKIVRMSPVPVIAIKNYVKPDRIKNIVFPNTLLSDANEDLVMKVKALQHLLGATLHIVYINTPLNFQRDATTKEELKRFSKWYMFKDFTINIFNDIDEEAGMINFTHMIGGDMIALGTHGRKGLVHILNGSLAEDLVNHADLPVWTYTIKKEIKI